MRIKTLRNLIFIILLIPVHCIGQKYIITSVCPSPISIGGREVHEGDIVSGTSIIELSNSKQTLRVVRFGEAGHPMEFDYTYLQNLNPKTLDNAWKNKESVGVSDDKSKTLGPKGFETSKTNTDSYLFFNGIIDSIQFGTEKRLALVIGNNSYIKLDCLTKPLIDADNMMNKLVYLGFDVMEVRDATETEMSDSFDTFFKNAADNNYNLLLVYFSGHGVWYNGKDYMLPINAKASNKYAEKNYYSANKLLKNFRDKVTKSSAGPKFIFIMDACRKAFGNTVILEENYPKLKENELLYYAVSVGENALQGVDDDFPSPFTKVLIDGIGTEGKNIYDEFYDVKCAVKHKYVNMNPTLLPEKGWFHENTFVKKKRTANSNTQNNEN